MREYEQKVASIHAWVIATKAENDELRKEVAEVVTLRAQLAECTCSHQRTDVKPKSLWCPDVKSPR